MARATPSTRRSRTALRPAARPIPIACSARIPGNANIDGEPVTHSLSHVVSSHIKSASAFMSRPSAFAGAAASAAVWLPEIHCMCRHNHDRDVPERGWRPATVLTGGHTKPAGRDEIIDAGRPADPRLSTLVVGGVDHGRSPTARRRGKSQTRPEATRLTALRARDEQRTPPRRTDLPGASGSSGATVSRRTGAS
jgi:hypothetical protein